MFSPNDMGLMLFALAFLAGAFPGFLLGYIIRDRSADKVLRELEARILDLATTQALASRKNVPR